VSRAAPKAEKPTRVRCAIYTRKSTEEGLAQEFNSLDAQREGAEAFVASQKAEGWIALPDRYDDGGFTGGNTERPALQRMLADIAAGKIDCVVVYKVDRLSRSLLDFTKVMETFERNGVSFVSVTQQFNTSHSMGRLTLNILLSFAQFEREIIGERIRDKLAAQRRRGQWAGGRPVLGYDVDRLSRSLMDFARIMSAFDGKGVSFVSVTQQFNTTSSMGRLTLNILLSFAQFEREIIGERIRDKIAAQKRRGKWAGGVPVLGYDVDRSGPSPHLVVNEPEAARVRQIFALYIEKGSLLPVVTELARRQWANKSRVTQTGRGKGKSLGGKAFDKCSLHQTLTNPIYLGKIVHKSAVYDGEHPPIIEADLFERVQTLLKTNGRTGGAEVRNKYGALLRGLLRCKCCDYAMTHTFAGGRKSRSYRYYRCVKAIKSGSSVCSSGTLPAGEIERVVVDEVRALATDRALITRVLTEAQAAIAAELEALADERTGLRNAIQKHHAALRELTTSGVASAASAAQIAHHHERTADAERRLPQIDARLADLSRETITRPEAEAAFADFDALWTNLIPREQARLLRLLISTVEYDAQSGTVAVTFRATSIRALITHRLEDAA